MSGARHDLEMMPGSIISLDPGGNPETAESAAPRASSPFPGLLTSQGLQSPPSGLPAASIHPSIPPCTHSAITTGSNVWHLIFPFLFFLFLFLFLSSFIFHLPSLPRRSSILPIVTTDHHHQSAAADWIRGSFAAQFRNNIYPW